MKKSTQSKKPRQPRRPRSSKRGRQGVARQVFDLRDHIRDGLLAEIRGAIAATAEQLVVNEVTELVGEPWSRKGDSALRRNGRTRATIFLDGEPHSLRRPFGSAIRMRAPNARSRASERSAAGMPSTRT